MLCFQDPSNRTKAGTIYRNTIILMIICKAWFSEGSESLGISRSDAFNPDGDGIPFETIAFVLTAVSGVTVLVFHEKANESCKVHNAILEYEKGYFVQRDFAAKKFSKQYMKYLGKLHKWHTFTTVQRNTRTSEKVRQELYTAAWYVVYLSHSYCLNILLAVIVSTLVSPFKPRSTMMDQHRLILRSTRPSNVPRTLFLQPKFTAPLSLP